MSYDLAIVILNYRTATMTIECLQSLAEEIAANESVCAVVVDNASGDGSADAIEAAIVDNGWNRVELVRNDVNGGFSAGNNVGIKHLEAGAYLLLNSDTLMQFGAIGELLTALRQHPEAGLIGPRILLPDGSLHDSCYRFMTPASELLYAAATRPLSRLLRRYEVRLPHPDTPSEVQWTSFACVAIRKQTIQQVGLMDEGYFMYFEDQDYCRRARAKGWKVLNWPRAKVVHRQGKSGPVRDRIASRKRPPRYFYAARARYFAKHFGRGGLWLTNTLWTLGRSVSLGRGLLGSPKNHLCERAAKDIWTNGWNPLQPTSIPPKEYS